MTWQHVLAWERLHGGECGDPRLLRFTGRPDELRCDKITVFNADVAVMQLCSGKQYIHLLQ